MKLVIFMIKFLKNFNLSVIEHQDFIVSKKQDNLMLIALISNFLVKFIKKCKQMIIVDNLVYENKKHKLHSEAYIEMPQDLWKNHCPIVLVHGFAGQTTDKNAFFKGYFHHCFD